MGRHRRTREENESLCIRTFPKENIILKHYMIRTWWLHLPDELGHHVIRLGEIEQIIMMTNNIMTLWYTYAKRRLNNTPKIFCQIAYISQLIACILSILSWTPLIQGRERYLLRTRLPKAFTETENQEAPIVFDTSTWYTLCDSGFSHFVNPYFDLYIYYKPLEKGGRYRIQCHWGLINTKGVVTAVLDL